MLSKFVKLLFGFVALLTGAVLVLALVVIETEPSVLKQDAPSPEDVEAAGQVYKDVLFVAQSGEWSEAPLIVSERQLQSAALLTARFVPGSRGDVTVAPSGIELRVSIPVPIPGLTRWLNVAVTVPEFENRLSLAKVALGRLSLPPDIALDIGRIGANLISEDQLGEALMTAASSMRIIDDRAYVDLQIDRAGKNGIMRGVFGALRGGEMPHKDLVESYAARIQSAMDRGDLPETGSVLPYLVFTLDAAHEGATERGEDPSDAFTASMFALSNICGSEIFFAALGSMSLSAPEGVRDSKERCAPLKLKDRIDIRRHFITAAALKAASNRQASMSVGEYKELNDALGRGFDFTDMAANNSGIRLAALFMATPAEDWPRLISRIEAEEDVIVSFDDIPRILSRQEFTARFGDIENERYMEMLDLIERRIDALSLHAPL
jgi:hypothetical protein